MEQTNIEKYLEKILMKNLGKEKGKNYYSCYYQSARSYLIQNVLPNIKAVEPELTDHGEKHIENVLKNTWRLLICDDDKDKGIDKYEDLRKLTCYDVYILCLSILFHDVGNIEGRKEHNKKVLKVYNAIRHNEPEFEPEKQLILKVTSAHCGTTKLGSLDTLKDVQEKDSLSGEPIKLQELASILRFADELAEGPQRTSNYLKIRGKSKIYHKYAQITDVFIDRGNERIVLTYNIHIENETKKSLRTLLLFAYKRLIKLDEERRYTKFYSNILTPFKKTEFTFNFIENNDPPKMSIGDILSDSCIIPGKKHSNTTDLINEFKKLNIDNIIKKLKLKG